MIESWSLAGGKAPVTRVENDISSHFIISQQFFKLETPVSLGTDEKIIKEEP